MDNTQVINLKEFFSQNTIEIPLYWNNQSKAIRIILENYSTDDSTIIIKRIFYKLIGTAPFFVCAYGYASKREIKKWRIFQNERVTFRAFDYRLKSVDPDDYIGEGEKIYYARVNCSSFSVDSYAQYVLHMDFLSNGLFLISDTMDAAIQVYDNRGMDVFLTDSEKREALKLEFWGDLDESCKC